MSSGGIIVKAENGSVVVNLTYASGATPQVWSDRALTSTVTLPATVAAGGSQSFFFQSPGTVTVSVKYSGREIADPNNGTTLTLAVSADEVSTLDYDVGHLSSAVTVGTTAGTVAAGDDSRITGAATAIVPTAVKTGNYTAVSGDLVPVDATGGNVTVTLPTAPADRTRVVVKLIAVSGTNAVTITCGGSDVFNKASGSTSLTLTLLNQAVSLQYATSTGVWFVVGDDMPLAALDSRYNASYLAQTAARRLSANAYGRAFYEPNLDTAMASPPTISAVTSTTGLVTGRTEAPFNDATNGIWNPNLGYLGLVAQWTTNNVAQAKPITYTLANAEFAVRIRHTGLRFELMQTLGQGGKYRVRVNGQWVQASESSCPAGSGTGFELYTFATRDTRDIEVWGRNWRFAGFRVDTTDTVQPVAETGPRVFVQGNSFSEGTSGATSFSSRFAYYVPRLLGTPDVCNVSVGGTDFLNNGGGTNGKTTIGARMAADVYANLDTTGRGNVLVLSNAAFNDTAFTTGQVTAAVAAWLQDVKANAPTMPVIVVGMSPMKTPSATQITYNDAVKAALDANLTCWALWIDPINGLWQTPDGRTGGPGAAYTRWQPTTAYATGNIREYGGVVYRATTGFTSPSSFTTTNWTTEETICWFFGTGKVGTTTGDGNADVCCFSDGTHPTDEGDRVITRNTVHYWRQAAALTWPV